MNGRYGLSTVIVAVAVASLMVFVLPAGIAAASTPDLTPGPSFTLWAYGAVRTVHFSGSSERGYQYQGTATYGYSVILDQINLTSQTFELSVNRTMGAIFSVEYCYPNCRNPTIEATLSHHAWEATDAWANFTTDGAVSEGAHSVPAIALLNSHSTVVGNLTDVAKGPERSTYFSANVTASASVSFDTPLGLLPTNLTAPLSWSSSSAFNASGEYEIGYFYALSAGGTTSKLGPQSLVGTIARSGTVTVVGSSSSGPDGSVNFDGVPYTSVSLQVEGPFVAREGFILVPSEVDLFGSASGSDWSANEQGATAVQMTSLYVRPSVDSHLGIGGSEWVYAASALNPSTTGPSPAVSGVGQIASGSQSVASTPVQGVPIAVSQAQGYQGCLVSGGGCPAVAPRSLLPLVTLGVLVVVVGSVIGMVLVAERRRMPPPAYPNAKLYPPGAAAQGTPAPSTAKPPAARPPPAAEDDPLANLW